MAKFLLMPVMIGFACLLAAAYGALHNQISYTVGPDYFHALKFIQFQIAPALPYRFGAAIVGVQASWWMGVVIGLPIALICLREPTTGAMAWLFVTVSVGIVALTLVLGLLSLLVPVTPAMLDALPIPRAANDPIGFVRAAILHEVSYGAGMVAMVLGAVYAFRATR